MFGTLPDAHGTDYRDQSRNRRDPDSRGDHEEAADHPRHRRLAIEDDARHARHVAPIRGGRARSRAASSISRPRWSDCRSAKIEDLKVGGSVIVTSTKGAKSDSVTAILLLANADFLVQMAQGQGSEARAAWTPSIACTAECWPVPPASASPQCSSRTGLLACPLSQDTLMHAPLPISWPYLRCMWPQQRRACAAPSPTPRARSSPARSSNCAVRPASSGPRPTTPASIPFPSSPPASIRSASPPRDSRPPRRKTSTSAQPQILDAQLAIHGEAQVVTVEDELRRVGATPEANGSRVVLRERQLAALSDDPDELALQLQALAGPAPGPGGGEFFIDGFTGGRLPPKSAIREVRINCQSVLARVRPPRLRAHRDLHQARQRLPPRPGLRAVQRRPPELAQSAAHPVHAAAVPGADLRLQPQRSAAAQQGLVHVRRGAAQHRRKRIRAGHHARRQPEPGEHQPGLAVAAIADHPEPAPRLRHQPQELADRPLSGTAHRPSTIRASAISTCHRAPTTSGRPSTPCRPPRPR